VEPSSHLWKVLGATSAWTRLADLKALLVFIANALMIATVARLVLANPAGHERTTQLAAMAGIALGAVSGLLALAAATPSFDKPSSSPRFHFTGVEKYTDSDLYKTAVEDVLSDETAVKRELTTLIHGLARVGARKHNRVKWALWLLPASFVVDLVAVLFV
jgi:hypothetical protein